MKIQKRDGSFEKLSFDKIIYRLRKISKDKTLGQLKTIDSDIVAQRVISGIYDGVSSCELDEEAARIAVSMTENIEYQHLASRIIISNLHKNTIECFSEVMETLYNNTDKNGNQFPIIADDVMEIIREHKNTLNFEIDFGRDYLFDYFGFKTLERAYLLKIVDKNTGKQRVVERPQHMYMRVAIGIHKNDIESAIKTYHLISQHFYTHASPTLFNSGTRLANLSSCFSEDTIVATVNRGPVKIKDVAIGDLVITHKGNVKPVVQLHKNPLGERKFYEIKITKTAPIKVTDNHKLWVIREEKDNVKQKKIKQTYDFNFVKNYLENDNCELLSTEYKNMKQKLLIKCVCGRTANVSFEGIYYKNVRCNDRKCIYERHNPIQELKSIYKPQWVSVEDLKKGDYIGIPNKTMLVDDKIKTLDITDFQIEKHPRIDYEINYNTKTVTVKSKYEQAGRFKHSWREHSSINRYWNIDKDFAKFIGIFYGDGHIMRGKNKHGDIQLRGIGITIYKHNVDLIEFCKNYGQKLFGIIPTIHTMKTQNVIQVIFSSVFVGHIFKELFGLGFNNKKVWSEIFKWDNDMIGNLLDGLITTDGCITTSNSVSLQMSNVNFMRELYYLFRNNNIDVSYGKPKIHKNATKHHVQICIPLDAIDKNNIHKFYTDNRMKPVKKYSKNHYSAKIVDGFKFLKFEDKTEIIENRPEYVYTLGVEEDHSYNVEGIVAENCFLIATDDTIEGIFKTITDCAKISKVAGGIGVHISNVRARGSVIRGTNGASDGLVPMLKVYNETAKYINQGSRRKGSFAVYLEPHHADIIEFLDLKKNQGHDDIRARDLFYAIWMSDLFMKTVEVDGDWYLMCPDECPGLNEVYGDEYEALYNKYVEEKRYRKVIKAQEVWKKILEAQIETGVPYIGYKDAVNKKCNQKNLGTIKSSNLCIEISLYSDSHETAVCFTGDTQVLTKHGYKRIDQCDNQEVLSYFDDDINLQEKQQFVKAKLIDNGIKDVYELKCSGTAPLKVTKNHLFAVIEKRNYDTKTNKYTWKKVEDLTIEDKIFFPKTIILPDYNICNNILESKKIDNEYLTVGWMLGDGWQHKSKKGNRSTYGVCFGPKEIYARDRVIKQLNEWVLSCDFAKCGYNNRTTEYYTDRNGVYNWASSKTNFIKLMKENFGLYEKTAHEKCIPEKIAESSPIQIASFLSGLFSADGSVYINNNNSKHTRFYITLSSASKNLLYQVQRLLKIFAIESCVVYGNVKNNTNSQGKISIENKESILNFYKYINFILSYEKQDILLSGIKTIKKIDVFTGHKKLVSLKYIGKERVYDLNVNNTHNFIAGGFVVHNCNLSSIALPKFVKTEGKHVYFDFEHLCEVAEYTVGPLNKVIDNNYYPIPETRVSNMKHRPLGIGVQGLADVYFKMGLPFESDEAKKLNREIFETVYYGCMKGTIEEAKKNGPYQSFKGSPFSQGKFQFDLAAEYDGVDLKEYLSGKWDWEALRSELITHGARNSMLVALMPTASTAQIMGNTESFEPIDSCIFKRRVLSGEYMITNKYLVGDLNKLGLWTKEMKERIIANDGSIQNIPEIPQTIKDVYKTVWEISMKKVIEQASERGVFVDQMQSMNLFMANPNYKKLTSMHFYAWKHHLKSGMYYLRSKASASAGKFSIDVNLEKQIREIKESGDLPDEEKEKLICSLENREACEMCSS